MPRSILQEHSDHPVGPPGGAWDQRSGVVRIALQAGKLLEDIEGVEQPLSDLNATTHVSDVNEAVGGSTSVLVDVRD